MKIFDCFMYFDEEIVLDLRLNTLNEYVDYFIIVESSFTHRGDKRKLKFNHDKFSKFKDKIIYLVYDEEPKNIETIYETDSKEKKSAQHIFNAAYRENGQRNFISEGLKIADKDDLILISDVDEIPNIKNIDLNSFSEKLIFFNQEMFYYKFNLKLPNHNWVGSRMCKKKYLKSPQWLRNIKNKKYPFYRFDIIFSDTKYSDIRFIDKGGWHFSNIKSAEEIRHKLKSYLHHAEFDVKPISVEEIDKLITGHQAIYDLNLDKRAQKIGHGSKLENYDLKKLPPYINNNLVKFKDWIE